MSVTEIALCAVVILLAAITVIVWEFLAISRRQHQATMAALTSLGDTHRIGYEALTVTMQRLEARVAQLEGRH